MTVPRKSDSSTSPETEATNRVAIRQLLWDIASINVHLDEIRHVWAKALGVSGPQWTILTAIKELDTGKGVPVKDVSAMLHVDPSFVTTQSKLLERGGFIGRVTSQQDARVVLMSLSDMAKAKMALLAGRRETLSDYVLAEIDDHAFHDMSDQLAKLKTRLQRAAVILSVDQS